MSSVLLLALATAVAQPAMAEARIAPAAHCLDARQTTGMYQSDDTTVVVAAGQQHYRVQLATSCPGLDRDSQLSLRAPGGWVCGGPNETVTAAGSRCPVASVGRRISSLRPTLTIRMCRKGRSGWPVYLIGQPANWC